MSPWIETPLISDQSSGEQLLGFRDSHWSLDSAEWSSDSVVELKMRKYPGNHVPAQLDLKIDCCARRAEVNGQQIDSLAQVEECLDKALVWR